MAESAHELEIAMRYLLDTGEGADLTLICRGKTWKVHSSYLWPRSLWFKAACKDGFQESETQRMELPEEEPSLVYRMLQHLYMQSYVVDLSLDKFWSSNDSWAVTPLHVHAQMYSLRDKYDLRILKKEAARRFSEDMKTLGNRKSQTLTLLSVVPTVYTTTPDSDRGLCNVLVQHVSEGYNTASKHFVEELDTALEVRQFARDIIVLLKKRPHINCADAVRNVYRICYRYIPPLPVAATPYLPNAASLRPSLPATIFQSGWVICLLLATLWFYHVHFGQSKMMVGFFEQRPRLLRCWARPPRGIEDWTWEVCWPVHSDKITFETSWAT